MYLLFTYNLYIQHRGVVSATSEDYNSTEVIEQKPHCYILRCQTVIISSECYNAIKKILSDMQ